MIVTKKIKLLVVGDKDEISRVYQYIRDGQYAQNKAYNILMSQVYAAIIRGADKEELNEIYRRGSRNSDSKLGSLYEDTEITFAKGLGTPASVGMAVRQDMQASIKAGLLKGNVSLRNKKRESPLLVPSRLMEIYHDYDGDEEMLKKLYDKDLEIKVKFVNGITFCMVFGNPYRSNELRTTVSKILMGEYVAKGSSIRIEDKSIYLNLAVDIGAVQKTLDEDSAIGVHYGFEEPVVVSNGKWTKIIGNTDYLIAQRTKIAEQRRRVLASLRYTNGGKGRRKKLRAMERFTKYEQNFAKTFNHQLSSGVIKYALENKAKYIYLEDIEKKNLDAYVLRNWSYYNFEEKLRYKAKKFGMEIRYTAVVEIDDTDITDKTIAKQLALMGKDDISSVSK